MKIIRNCQSLGPFLLNLSSDSIIENRKEQSLILFYRLFRFIYVPLLIKKVYFSYIPKYNKILFIFLVKIVFCTIYIYVFLSFQQEVKLRKPMNRHPHKDYLCHIIWRTIKIIHRIKIIHKAFHISTLSYFYSIQFYPRKPLKIYTSTEQ